MSTTPVGPAYGGLCPRSGTKAGHRQLSRLLLPVRVLLGAGRRLHKVVGQRGEGLGFVIGRGAQGAAGDVNCSCQAYNENCRSYVEWKHPLTKKTIRAPVWSRDSITRHLLYSVEFPLFDESVNQIYHSLIVAEQNVVMDPTTNRVRPEAKKELLTTIGSYAKWLETRDRIASSGTKRKRGT